MNTRIENRCLYLGNIWIHRSIPRNTSKCMGEDLFRVVSIFRIWSSWRSWNFMEWESRHWKSKVSKRNLDSSKEKRLLITLMVIIEGAPSKSALFVNGYDWWICSRLPIAPKTQWICFRERAGSNDIHSLISCHVETVALLTRTK